MKLSCGIIIINEHSQLLMGHATGQSFYDIPKGGLDENEEPIVCAIRECGEETSIVFTTSQLKDLGEYKYNAAKNLHLFTVFVKSNDYNLSQLKCESFFEHPMSKKVLPEVDGFKWVDISEESFNKHCAKSMAKLLLKLKNDGLLEKEKLIDIKKKNLMA